MKRVKQWLLGNKFLAVWTVIQGLLMLVVLLAESGKMRALSAMIWGTVLLGFWLLGKPSRFHTMPLQEAGKGEKIFLFLLVLVLILGCTLPMGISPVYNGMELNQRNQYEMITESFLKGQLHFDYEPDPRLLAMENPYDTYARESNRIDYHWDHAFYNGKYYMYFGVVPVFLLFMPYRLITGTALTTYHATQIFSGMTILGIFAVLGLFARVFFRKMSFAMYACLGAAFSVVSVWYATGTPALYCTAITGAICLMVWSVYCFSKAVWDTEKENCQILWAFFGSLFGALAFGCRPPVALANLLVLPMLWVYLKKKKLSWKLAGKLALAALPYVLVAAALMAYNYARFEDPFEFGQAYQLTNTDQSRYGDFWANFDPGKILKGVWENFLSWGGLTDSYPFLTYSGALVNFPILLLGLTAFLPKVRRGLRETGLGGLMGMLLAVPVVITVIDVMWAPFLEERYRMDIYFVMGMGAFLAAGCFHSGLKTRQAQAVFSRVLAVASAFTVLTCFFLWLIPYDSNPTQYYPGLLILIRRFLFLDL